MRNALRCIGWQTLKQTEWVNVFCRRRTFEWLRFTSENSTTILSACENRDIKKICTGVSTDSQSCVSEKKNRWKMWKIIYGLVVIFIVQNSLCFSRVPFGIISVSHAHTEIIRRTERYFWRRLFFFFFLFFIILFSSFYFTRLGVPRSSSQEQVTYKTKSQTSSCFTWTEFKATEKCADETSWLHNETWNSEIYLCFSVMKLASAPRDAKKSIDARNRPMRKCEKCSGEILWSQMPGFFFQNEISNIGSPVVQCLQSRRQFRLSK